MIPKFIKGYFLCGWVALALVLGMGSGCGFFPVRPEVTSEVSDDVIYLTVEDYLEKSTWMETLTWTVRCEAEEGKTCEGSPTLSFPRNKTICRYDYQILEGPEGNTEQVVRIKNASSLKVHIRAVGGPSWSPYKSKMVLQVRAVGIDKEVDPETRKILNCKPHFPSTL